MQVCETTDRDAIQAFLEQDRGYAAYALGDLEPPLSEQSTWYVAEVQGILQGLVLRFTGLEPHALFLMGEAQGLRALLGQAPLPFRAYLTCRPTELKVAMAAYELVSLEYMWRMVLPAGAFQPVSGEAARLGSEGYDELMALYQQGGEGFLFRRYQLEQGVYYGVRVDGELVTAAGTHLVAPGAGIGCVGNVFTQEAHRRQGYGAIAASAVVAELSGLVPTVVLNVRQDNLTAIRLYERLGFQPYCPFVEAMGFRR